jgi:hypothetical protein
MCLLLSITFFGCNKDSSLVHYGIYYGHKKFYDTGPSYDQNRLFIPNLVHNYTTRHRGGLRHVVKQAGYLTNL